jgi:hypothetical protein
MQADAGSGPASRRWNCTDVAWRERRLSLLVHKALASSVISLRCALGLLALNFEIIAYL